MGGDGGRWGGTGGGRWSFAHSPAAHLLLCGLVLNRYQSAARGLGTPAAENSGEMKYQVPLQRDVLLLYLGQYPVHPWAVYLTGILFCDTLAVQSEIITGEREYLSVRGIWNCQKFYWIKTGLIPSRISFNPFFKSKTFRLFILRLNVYSSSKICQIRFWAQRHWV